MVRNFREGTMGETRVFQGELTDLPAVADFVHQQSRRVRAMSATMRMRGLEVVLMDGRVCWRSSLKRTACWCSLVPTLTLRSRSMVR